MGIIWQSGFETSTTESGQWSLQAFDSGRATLVDFPADGVKGVKLRTAGTTLNPPNGDINIAGSGSGERCDLARNELIAIGEDVWLAHSVYLPDAYNHVQASTRWYTFFDIHQDDGVGVQAMLHVDPSRYNGRVTIRGYGQSPTLPTEVLFQDIEAAEKNVWYHWVHNIKIATSGWYKTWLKKGSGPYTQVAEFIGQTVYNGGMESNTPTWQANTAYGFGAAVKPTTPNGHRYVVSDDGTTAGSEPTWPTTNGNTVNDGSAQWRCGPSEHAFYIKLANYHEDAWADPSDIIHDRIIRGQSFADVAIPEASSHHPIGSLDIF